jgi:hypothetical protein
MWSIVSADVLILPITGTALRAYHRLLHARANMNDAEKSSCEVGKLSIYVVLPYPEDLADMKCALLRVHAYRPHGIRDTRPLRGWLNADSRAVGLPEFFASRCRPTKTRRFLVCKVRTPSSITAVQWAYLLNLANTVNVMHDNEDLLR